MKYNITTLKKEVPKNIRLEVYKEALNQKDWLMREGLCLVLPKIMLGLQYSDYLCFINDSQSDYDSSGKMSWRDAGIAFTELTKCVIKDIQQYPTNEKRIQYLEQWIKELEGHNEQNNTEK